MNAKSFLDWVKKALVIVIAPLFFLTTIVIADDAVSQSFHTDKNTQNSVDLYDSSSTLLCNADLLIDNIFLTLQSLSLTPKAVSSYTDKLTHALESVKLVIDKKRLSSENFLLAGRIVKNSSHAMSALLPREQCLSQQSFSLEALVEKVITILSVICDGPQVHAENLLMSAEAVHCIAMVMGDLVQRACLSKQLLVLLIQHAGKLAQIINRIVLHADAMEDVYTAACSSGNAIARVIALIVGNNLAEEAALDASFISLSYLFDAIKIIVHKPDVTTEIHVLISGVLNHIGSVLSLLTQNFGTQPATIDNIAILLSKTIHLLNEINNEEIVSVESLVVTAKTGYVLAVGLNAIASKAIVSAVTLDVVCSDAELLAQLMNAVGGDLLANADVRGDICKVAEILAACVVSLAKNDAITSDLLSHGASVLSAALGSVKVISYDSAASVENLSSAARGVQSIAQALLALAEHRLLGEEVTAIFGNVLTCALSSVANLSNHREGSQASLQATIVAMRVLMQSVGRVAFYSGDGSRKLLLALGIEIERLIDGLMLIALGADKSLQESLCLATSEAILALASIIENSSSDEVLLKQGVLIVTKTLSLADIIGTKATCAEIIERVAEVVKNCSIPLSLIIDHTQLSVGILEAVNNSLGIAFATINKLAKHIANNATSLFYIVNSAEALAHLVQSIACRDQLSVEVIKKIIETARMVTLSLKQMLGYSFFSDGSQKVVCVTVRIVSAVLRCLVGMENLEDNYLDDCIALLSDMLNDIKNIVHKEGVSPLTMYYAQIVLEDMGQVLAVIATRKNVHDAVLLKSVGILVNLAQMAYELCNYSLLDSRLTKKVIETMCSLVFASQDIAKKNTTNVDIRRGLLQVILLSSRTIREIGNKCTLLRIKQEDSSHCCKQLVTVLQLLSASLQLSEEKSICALSIYLITDFLKNSTSALKINEYGCVAKSLKTMIDSLAYSWGIVVIMSDYKDDVDDCIKENSSNDLPCLDKKIVAAIRNYAYVFLQQYENFFERLYRYYLQGF